MRVNGYAARERKFLGQVMTMEKTLEPNGALDESESFADDDLYIPAILISSVGINLSTYRVGQ
jgi:hypothetical protein